MNQAKNGDRVKVHYTEKLENGRVLDTSKGDLPLEIKIGNNTVPLLERVIKGMKILETKSITIKPEKAYGPRRKELITEIKKNKLPKNFTPAIGQRIKLRQEHGDNIDAVIMDIKENTITLDANHPLAGATLILEVELIDIA